MGAIGIKLTLNWNAEAEFAERSSRAVYIGHAFVGRKRDASTRDAPESVRTIDIAHATIWNFADVVIADHPRKRTVLIGLARNRWRTTSSRAHPERRTLRLRDACEWDAVTEVTTLAHRTVGVLLAIWSLLAEEAVADRARRAIRVRDTLSEVDTSIVDALEAGLAVCVAATVDARDARSRNRFAFLTRRAIGISIASTRDVTEVIDTDFGGVAIAIVSAVPREDASSVRTNFVRWAIDVGHTLWWTGFARSVHASEIFRTIEVGLAHADRNALAIIADGVRWAADVRAGVRSDAAEVVAHFVRSTIEVASAIADEETLVVDADFRRTTIFVQDALSDRNALARLADFVRSTIEVTETLAEVDTTSFDAFESWRAVVVLYGTERRFAGSVFADETTGAITVETALVARDTNIVAAYLAVGAIEISVAGLELAEAVDALTAESAIVVPLTLRRDALVVHAELSVRAVS